VIRLVTIANGFAFQPDEGVQTYFLIFYYQKQLIALFCSSATPFHSSGTKNFIAAAQLPL
jgi:hypothetical protein